jgi:hypothetical protein
MRGRLGLLIGLGAGYVLGARAGQERYEQIRAQFNQLMGSEQAQQLQAQMREAAGRAGEVIEEKASGGIAKVSEMVGSGGSGGSGSSTGNNDVVLPPT